MATTRMTRADAGRAYGEKEIMRYAARNVRICEMRALGGSNKGIAEETGLSPSRTSRIISKGEDHWQMWLERALEDGIEQEGVPGAIPRPDVELVELIDITTIQDNPWQPRKTVREDDVATLLEDIAENGLHHAVLLRPNRSGPELVLGQLRLMAFRMGAESEEAGAIVMGAAWEKYYDGDTGITRIPAILREMKDREVIIASLSENLNRNAMVWSDETRALELATQQEGVTARQVAAAAKMSPAQLSNRRRLLKLNDKTLSLIDDGILSWTAARELLAFAPDDHIHQDEIDYCEERLWAMHKGDAERRLTAKDVLTVMANSMGLDSSQWEQLAAVLNFWIRGNSHKERPLFDVGEFKKSYGEFVHTLPYLFGTVTVPKKVEVTCLGWDWRKYQADAEEKEAQKRNAETAHRLAVKEAQKDEEPSQLGLGAVATAFSNENIKAVYLPRQILHMLEDARLSREFVQGLLDSWPMTRRGDTITTTRSILHT